MSGKGFGEALASAAPRGTAVLVLLIAIVAAALLAGPGQTVSAKYLNDLMIFLDGAHRILAGQIPHVDFHTPMGPLTNLVPAVGLWLTGSRGAALPVGNGLLILCLAPVMAHILVSRLSPALAVGMALYLALIVAAPANLGEPPQVLTFAMFYNRIGWAALALLLVMVLPPRGSADVLRDGLSAAALTLLMLYMKATYGAVALAFLAALLLERHARAWAALALAVTVAITLALELATGLPSGYVRDLAQATHASASGYDGPMRLLYLLRTNAFDYVAFALVCALAAAALRDWRLVLFLAFTGGAGLMIQHQNFQNGGIVVLAAGAAVVAEAIWRRRRADGPRLSPTLAAAGALCLALAAPLMADRSIALGTHVRLAATNAAHRFALPRLDRIVLADTGSAYDVSYTGEYVATLDDGARALAALGTAPGPVAVLDFVNPFSVGLNLPPPRGDYSVSQFGRTFNDRHFLPPERTLRDARLVMVPKWSIDAPGTAAFLTLYAHYLSRHYAPVRETAFWRVYARRDGEPGPVVSRVEGVR